jgi:hypothetical protein
MPAGAALGLFIGGPAISDDGTILEGYRQPERSSYNLALKEVPKPDFYIPELKGPEKEPKRPLELFAGYSFPSGLGPPGKIEYGQIGVRKSLTDFNGKQFEILGELLGSPYMNKKGKWFAGTGLIGRHYLLDKDSDFPPYIQAGAGGLITNYNKEGGQELIGLPFAFNLQGGVGIKIPIEKIFKKGDPKKGQKVFSEIIFYHFSNGGLDKKNGGMNNGCLIFGWEF